MIYNTKEYLKIAKVGDVVRNIPGKNVACAELERDGSNTQKITKVGEGKIWINNCWHEGFEDYFLEVVETTQTNNKKSFMKNLTPMLKTLLDKPARTLFKAGYINGDLELTEEGRSALNTILFNANKVALVKMAQEVLDEEKENK